jgi:hypothetical protein
MVHGWDEKPNAQEALRETKALGEAKLGLRQSLAKEKPNGEEET